MINNLNVSKMTYVLHCPDDELTISREEFKEKFETETFVYKEWLAYIFGGYTGLVYSVLNDNGL